MRLLNVKRFEFDEFRDDNRPKYVIASHRWADEEATFQDVMEKHNQKSLGYKKVEAFARYVREEVPSVEWLWIDTCCINRNSDAELSYSINSMFKWYRNAELCIAYLAETTAVEDRGSFKQDEWFRRGWTLQELLAPRLVIFVTKEWRVIGNKGSSFYRCGGTTTGPDLGADIADATGIPERVLNDWGTSVNIRREDKMRWIEGRRTGREEDMSYALFGIVGVAPGANYGEGQENARQRLVAAIRQRDEMAAQQAGQSVPEGRSIPAATAPTAYSNLLIPKNRRFVGRTDELEAVERKLFIDAHCQRVAIVGLGGIGKTQVALAFAHSVQEKRPEYSVFWVSALSTETIKQGFEEIAQLCELSPDPNGKDDITLLVKRHLSASAAGHWLLIVDNVDDAKILGRSGTNKSLNDYLPGSRLGLIIFTTRSVEIAQSLVGGDIVRLERMGKKQAAELLRQSLHDIAILQDEASATDLLIQLDYLPLAITQAAAYMNINSISIPEYVDLLNSTEQDLVDIMSTEFRDRTRYEQAANAVASTWIVSFTQIVEQDATAAELLRYICCIEWKAIPHSILPDVQPIARMTRAIGRLCSYSFLTKRADCKTYDMHRLVHLAIRIWIDQKGMLDQTRQEALRTLLDKFPSNHYTNRQMWRKYLPHVAQMCHGKHCNEMEEKGELCMKVGQCLLVDGRTKEAMEWLERSRDLRMELVEDHTDRLASQHELAIAYQANGQVKDAVALLEHVVKVEGEVLAEDHPDRLAEDHPDRLASQHALATAYRANGQVKDAVALLEHVVKVEGEVLAEDHPSRLASQHALAIAYEANGQVKDAVALLEHVVKVEGEVLAEDHPSRLASQHELAIAYEANGQVKDGQSRHAYSDGQPRHHKQDARDEGKRKGTECRGDGKRARVR